jgi:hypothetical protein
MSEVSTANYGRQVIVLQGLMAVRGDRQCQKVRRLHAGLLLLVSFASKVNNAKLQGPGLTFVVVNLLILDSLFRLLVH